MNSSSWNDPPSKSARGLAGDDYNAQLRRWREAAETVQAAITAHAEAVEASRYGVEQAMKKAVPHT
ncbi:MULTISPECIES: hypothetical protein [unclassified Streptomyces]|uniref:hypothetical protein n=1 Tax=unclassified Streptomyces TaxID=2593676 RepID=UPI003686DD72